MVLINPSVEQLGAACAIVHGRARRYEMRGVRAPLSLKTVVRGVAEWRTAAGRFEITPGMLLLVNDGEEYSIEVDSLQPVETFCVLFGRLRPAFRSASAAVHRFARMKRPARRRRDTLSS